MKKIFNIFLLVLVMFAMVSCKKDKTLATPTNVQISEAGLITWNVVENAESYIVYINNQEYTVKDLLNQVEGLVENVVAYDNIDLDDVSTVLAPAPYIVDKLDLHIEKEWASFYRLIGITSIVEEKKERLITDEVSMGQGGTVASRYNRYEPRKSAINKINKKWNLNIEIEYYDGVPSTNKEVDKNVSNTNNISENIFTN